MLECMLGVNPKSGCVMLPGGSKLCYLGAVSLIDGNVLASQIGLTAGTAINATAPFLHFELNGKAFYMAQKPFRHSLTWNQIHARGAVFGTRTIAIGGKTYKVRVPRGGVASTTSTIDPSWGYGSEFNYLMTSIRGGINTPSGEGLTYGTIAQLSGSDLAGNIYTICQETATMEATWRTLRGGASALHGHVIGIDQSHSTYGWRPILEQI